MKDFFLGISSWFKSINLIFSHGLAKYYLYPLLLSIVYYSLIFGIVFRLVAASVSDFLSPYVPDHIPGVEEGDGMLKWLSNVSLLGIAGVMAGILIALLSFKTGKYIILIFMSPVFSLLSEKLEEKISGKKYDFSFSGFVKDIIRGVIINLRNMFLEIATTILLWILAFIFPPLSLISVPLIFLTGAYFTGFSLMDYSLERRFVSVSETARYVRKNKWLSIGIGSVYQILDSIPLVALLIAPVNGVVAAFSGIHEKDRESL